ncbi:exported hypothetical protein [Alteromonas infernus]
MGTTKKGSLIVVGTGISVAGQMTVAARSHIENADIVFMGIMNKIGEHVVTKLNSNSVSLDDLYEEGKSRALTYSQMADRIVQSVVEGNKVCVAFYGHPGVFVTPSHEAFAEYKSRFRGANVAWRFRRRLLNCRFGHRPFSLWLSVIRGHPISVPRLPHRPAHDANYLANRVSRRSNVKRARCQSQPIRSGYAGRYTGRALSK